MATLRGDAALKLLDQHIEHHQDRLDALLKPLSAAATVKKWLLILQRVEEFINAPGSALDEASDDLWHEVAVSPITLGTFAAIDRLLSPHLSPSVLERYRWMLGLWQTIEPQLSPLVTGESNALRSIASLTGYLQSRRRHMVALLHAMPSLCQGHLHVSSAQLFYRLMEAVELDAIPLTGRHAHKMLVHAVDNFALTGSRGVWHASHGYSLLDGMFLEPERLAIMHSAAHSVRAESWTPLEPTDPQLVFTVAELRNNIKLMLDAYSEFHLANTSFSLFAGFVENAASQAADDYHVKLSKQQFDALTSAAQLTAAQAARLVHVSPSHAVNVNAIAPFVMVGRTCYSTVTLLSRFLYYWVGIALKPNRRFQIRAGFIFEAAVKEKLSEFGYTVLETKRIEQQEFDVLAMRDGVLFNLQCKNNLMDIGAIESNPKRFGQVNKRLAAYYDRALAKEDGRVGLLQQHLGCSQVQNLLVSRFPVITNNPRVMGFNGLHRLK